MKTMGARKSMIARRTSNTVTTRMEGIKTTRTIKATTNSSAGRKTQYDSDRCDYAMIFVFSKHMSTLANEELQISIRRIFLRSKKQSAQTRTLIAAAAHAPCRIVIQHERGEHQRPRARGCGGEDRKAPGTLAKGR